MPRRGNENVSVWLNLCGQPNVSGGAERGGGRGPEFLNEGGRVDVLPAAFQTFLKTSYVWRTT